MSTVQSKKRNLFSDNVCLYNTWLRHYLKDVRAKKNRATLSSDAALALSNAVNTGHRREVRPLCPDRSL